jgi:hypothetical protein
MEGVGTRTTYPSTTAKKPV